MSDITIPDEIKYRDHVCKTPAWEAMFEGLSDNGSGWPAHLRARLAPADRADPRGWERDLEHDPNAGEPGYTATAESIADLRMLFIRDAEYVVRGVLDRAIGRRTSIAKDRVDQTDLDRAWEVLSPLLRQSGELRKIEAQTTKQILAGVAGGKLTIQEANDLMEILKVQQDIEELPKLLEQLSED